MSLLVSADSGFEKFVQFAKRKLIAWKAAALRAGVATINKTIFGDEGTVIYVNSVNLGYGQYRDRIRITGGAVAGRARFSPTGSMSGAFYAYIDVSAKEWAYLPISTRVSRYDWRYVESVADQTNNVATGLYRKGVKYDAPFLDDATERAYGDGTSGLPEVQALSPDHGTFLVGQAADEASEWQEYIVRETYIAGSEPTVVEDYSLVVPSAMLALRDSPGASEWSLSPFGWSMRTNLHVTPTAVPPPDSPIYQEMFDQTKLYNILSVASSREGNFAASVTVLPYATTVTPGAKYVGYQADGLGGWIASREDQVFSAVISQRCMVETIDLRDGARAAKMDTTHSATWRDVVYTTDAGDSNSETGTLGFMSGALLQPYYYPMTLRVNDAGVTALSVVEQNDTVDPAGDTLTLLDAGGNWTVDVPLPTVVSSVILAKLFVDGAEVWSHDMAGNEIDVWEITSAEISPTVGMFSAQLTGFSGPTLGIFYDGAAVVERALSSTSDAFKAFVAPDENTYVLTVDGKWAEFYAEGALVETLTLLPNEKVVSASHVTNNMYYTTDGSSTPTSHKRHKLTKTDGTWTRTATPVALQDTLTVPPAPNNYTDDGIAAGDYLRVGQSAAFFSESTPQYLKLNGFPPGVRGT